MAETDTELLRQLTRQYSAQGEAICRELNERLRRHDLHQALRVPDFATAQRDLLRDVYSGEAVLQAIWHDASGLLRGRMTIRADGGFHAEYDVIQPLPADAAWFVEAVTAWGNQQVMKSELKLLPALN